MLPGFHDWFQKKQITLFKESVIRSPLDRATLGNSFYNNRLEVLHKLQKKRIEEGKIEHEVCQISKALEHWTKSYNREAVQAIHGHGKHKLAPAFEHFYVELTKWFRWNEQRRKQHIASFMQFTPRQVTCIKNQCMQV